MTGTTVASQGRFDSLRGGHYWRRQGVGAGFTKYLQSSLEMVLGGDYLSPLTEALGARHRLDEPDSAVELPLAE